MGNIISDNNKFNNNDLLNKINLLENKIDELNNKISDLESKKPMNIDKVKSIDEFVDNWYEENKEVDIGVINLPLVGDIDILPDKIEKHIYKKSLLIASTLMEDMLENINFNMLDKNIKFDVK